MLEHVGKRFVSPSVLRRYATPSRLQVGPPVVAWRAPSSRDVRCDGSGHGGCQAGCRIYWKEAWLRPAGGELATHARDAGIVQLKALAREKACVAVAFPEAPEESVYSCQATEALNATTVLRIRQLGQYWREFSSGNAGFWHVLRIAIRAATTEVRSRLHVRNSPPLRIHAGVSPRPSNSPEPTKPLALQVGEWVRIKSPRQIAETIDAGFRTRGLWFDREMTPFCSGTYRVQARVNRIIDERSGRMIEIASDCLILEGVVCSGERSIGRWFCPRAIYPYWREAWLERADAPSAGKT